MKKNCIYGVNLNGEITPIIVRDAIIECFVKAHKDILDQMREYAEFKSEDEFKEMEKTDVTMLIQKMFSDAGYNFDEPNKEALIKIVESLKDYTTHFRKPEIIEKHAGEIMQLIEKLK